MWLYCVKGTGKIKNISLTVLPGFFFLNASIYFLNCIKLFRFTEHHVTRSHTFITAEVSATGRRSFTDDMTGRFGIGTMHGVFQVVGTVFVEKHALNIIQKKKKKKKCKLTLSFFTI